jgi:hypothetical protein
MVEEGRHVNDRTSRLAAGKCPACGGPVSWNLYDVNPYRVARATCRAVERRAYIARYPKTTMDLADLPDPKCSWVGRVTRDQDGNAVLSEGA